MLYFNIPVYQDFSTIFRKRGMEWYISSQTVLLGFQCKQLFKTIKRNDKIADAKNRLKITMSFYLRT